MEFRAPAPGGPQPIAGLRGLEGLSLRGFAPAVSQPRVRPQPRAIQEAMWEHARGGENIQKVPVDKIPSVQEVESGGFKAHEIPQASSPVQGWPRQTHPCSLPSNSNVLAKGMTNLDDIVIKLRETIAEGYGLSLEETKDLATELADEATRPLAQAFRLVASKANDLHLK